MEHSDAIHDIAAALMALRAACRKHHIPEPDILRWTDPKMARDAKLALYSTASSTDLMEFRNGRPVDTYGDQIVGFNFEYV